MSKNYRKPAALFLDGRIDKALGILSEEHLKQMAADAKKQLEEAKKKQQENILRSWVLRSQMLALTKFC
ncbi:hypothetical protein [Nitrosospira sp. Is2]|uniref:hypothetical protein n=1 Tax=Nitrosospira sp. Is2 TaxID=3080532 RepID=UPI0029551543|nr:hypothetical protein [Nitrosospira sp. Is2]WON74228.1 hypothetical protein R5L00_01690 [Nitrosospira sp. Is2]